MSILEKTNVWDFSVYDDIEVGERTSKTEKINNKYHPKKSGYVIPIERFWEYIEKNSESGCWEWIGNRDTLGYGCLNFLGKREKAHRISYSMRFGKIPEGLVILHKCDNPSCINPDHLMLGTPHDNTQDMIKKSRYKYAKNCTHPRMKR